MSLPFNFNLRRTALVLVPLALGLVTPAFSQERSRTLFMEGGIAERETHALSAGASWPWGWRTDLGSLRVSGATEAFVSLWNWRSFGGGRQTSLMVAAVPVFRFTPDVGRSPWFFEGGIGLSLASERYNTPDKQFSTAWNFYDTIGVGRSLGAGQELTVRLTHLSNAGIRRPNPGENFLQLRYSRAF